MSGFATARAVPMKLFAINKCPYFFWRFNVRIVAKAFKNDGLRIIGKHM